MRYFLTDNVSVGNSSGQNALLTTMRFTFGATSWWRNGGCIPQKRQWVIERLPPARRVVKAPAAPSGTLSLSKCRWDEVRGLAISNFEKAVLQGVVTEPAVSEPVELSKYSLF
jgi:hypothetical protein